MGVSVRPEQEQERQQDDPVRLEMRAEWDRLTQSGVSPEEATKRTTEMYRQRTGKAPELRSNLTGLITGEPVETEPETTKAQSILASLANALTFGHGPQATAVIESLGTGKPYDEALANRKALYEQSARDNPATSTTAEIAGAFVPAAFGASFLPAAITKGIGRVGAGAVAGGVSAGLYGIGNDEGTFRERAEAVRDRTMVGAPLGAAAAAAAPHIAKGAGYLADLFRVRPGGGPPSGMAPAAAAAGAGSAGRAPGTSLVVRGARSGGKVPPASPTTSASSAAEQSAFGAAGSAVGGAASRAARAVAGAAGVESVDDRALDLILRKIGQSRRTLEEASTLAPSTPPGTTVMEVFEEPMRRLGRATHSVPSEGGRKMTEALVARQAGTEDRVLGTLFEATGSKRVNVKKTINALDKERGKMARENYAQVYDATVDAPGMGRFFGIDAFRNAYKRSLRMNATERAIGEADDIMPPLEQLLDEAGNLRQPLTIRQIDRIKRALDDELGVGRRSPTEAGGLGNEEESILRDAKKMFVAMADNAVPDYETVRGVYAGQSAMIDAFDQGSKLWKTSIDEAEALVSEMGEAEREAFMKGAIQGFAERVEGMGSGADVAARTVDKTLDQKRLRLLFPDEESFTRFRDMLAEQVGERGFATTNRFVRGGSQTVDKMAELLDLAPTGVPLGKMAQLGDFLARTAMARGVQGHSERLADALAPKLLAGTEGAPQTLTEVLEDLLKRRDAVRVRGMKPKTGAGAAASAEAGRRERR